MFKFSKSSLFFLFILVSISNIFGSPSLNRFSASVALTGNPGTFKEGVDKTIKQLPNIKVGEKELFKNQLRISLDNAIKIIPTIAEDGRSAYLDLLFRLIGSALQEWTVVKKIFSQQEMNAFLEPYRNWYTEQVDALGAQLAGAKGLLAGAKAGEEKAVRGKIDALRLVKAERDAALQRATDAERRAADAEAARRVAEARPPEVIERKVKEIVEVVPPAMQAELEELRIQLEQQKEDAARAVDAENKTKQGEIDAALVEAAAARKVAEELEAANIVHEKALAAADAAKDTALAEAAAAKDANTQALEAARLANEEALRKAKEDLDAAVAAAEEALRLKLSQAFTKEKEDAEAALEEERKELVNLRAQLFTLTEAKEKRDAEDLEALTKSQIIRIRARKLVTNAEARLDTTRKELRESKGEVPQHFKEDDFLGLSQKIKSEILDKDIREIGYDTPVLVATRSLLNAMANVQQGLFGVNVANIAQKIELLQLPTTSLDDEIKLEEEIDALEEENEEILRQKNQITDQIRGLDGLIYAIRVKEKSDKENLEEANRELMSRSSIFTSSQEDKDREIADLERQLQESQKSKEESVGAAKNAQAEWEKEKEQLATDAAEEKRVAQTAWTEEKNRLEKEKGEVDQKNADLTLEVKGLGERVTTAEEDKRKAEEDKVAAEGKLADAHNAHEEETGRIIVGFNQDIEKLNKEGHDALLALRVAKLENKELKRHIPSDKLQEALATAEQERDMSAADVAELEQQRELEQLAQMNIGARRSAALKGIIDGKESGYKEAIAISLGYANLPDTKIGAMQVTIPGDFERQIDFIYHLVINSKFIPAVEAGKKAAPRMFNGFIQTLILEAHNYFLRVRVEHGSHIDKVFLTVAYKLNQLLEKGMVNVYNRGADGKLTSEINTWDAFIKLKNLQFTEKERLGFQSPASSSMNDVTNKIKAIAERSKPARTEGQAPPPKPAAAVKAAKKTGAAGLAPKGKGGAAKKTGAAGV